MSAIERESNSLPLGSNAVIFGRKGSGKTTLARRLLAHHSRTLIVDPLREYGEVAVQVASPPDLAEYVVSQARWRVAYHNEEMNREFEGLCRVAMALGNCLFLIEEADWFCDPTSIPEELERLVKYGRHHDIITLVISRRPSEVHRLLTSQAYAIYCFTTQEPRDLEYLGRLVGREFADGLGDLPPYHYRYQNLWDRSGGMEEKVLA